MKMRRVAVIGPPGAGKSTLSRRLARVTGLPVVHLDRHFWSEGWVTTPRAQWERAQLGMIRERTWIIDGNYGSTLDLRLAAADTVIFLDLPRGLYVRRVVTRMLRSFILRQRRTDLAPGCPERPDLNWFRFLRWVLDFGRDGRPELLRHIRGLSRDTHLFWLRRPDEVGRLLAGLQAGEGPPRSGPAMDAERCPPPEDCR